MLDIFNRFSWTLKAEIVKNLMKYPEFAGFSKDEIKNMCKKPLNKELKVVDCALKPGVVYATYGNNRYCIKCATTFMLKTKTTANSELEALKKKDADAHYRDYGETIQCNKGCTKYPVSPGNVFKYDDPTFEKHDKHSYVWGQINSRVELWALKRVGKSGGIVFDCFIKGHNHFLEEKYSKKFLDTLNDKFILGTKGKKITKADVSVFVKALEKYATLKLWNNGRTYFYEGIDSTGIFWGS